MDIVGIVVSVVAAIASVIALIFTVRNSKGYILKRIDQKEKIIRNIDFKLVQLYGLNRGQGGIITPLDARKSKLKKEIEELKRKL